MASNTVIVDLNSSADDPQMQFEYDVQNGIVKSVSIQHEWDQVFYLAPLSGDPLRMACSLLLAQEGCGIKEAAEFTRLFESYLDQKTTSFTYKNLLIEWTIDTDLDMQQGIIFGADEESTYATLNFRVTIR